MYSEVERELFDIPYCSNITAYSSFLKNVFVIISTSIYNWKEKLWKIISRSLAFLCKGMCIAVPILRDFVRDYPYRHCSGTCSNGGLGGRKSQDLCVCVQALPSVLQEQASVSSVIFWQSSDFDCNFIFCTVDAIKPFTLSGIVLYSFLNLSVILCWCP